MTAQVFLCLCTHNPKKTDDNASISPGGKLYKYKQSIKNHYAILKLKRMISLDSLECKKRRLKMLLSMLLFAMIESAKQNTSA